MIARVIFLWGFLISWAAINAQERYLLLDKPGFRRDRIFYTGDPVTFRMSGEKFDRHDQITGFNDSSIVFNSYQVVIRDLDYVKFNRDRGFMNPFKGAMFIIPGLALPLADFLNYSVVEGNRYHPDQSILIVSGSLVTGGLVWYSFRHGKFRSGSLRKFVISAY